MDNKLKLYRQKAIYRIMAKRRHQDEELKEATKWIIIIGLLSCIFLIWFYYQYA